MFSKGTQLSNLWWMSNSASKCLDTAMKRAHQNDSNDTPQPICEFQVVFPLLRIRINQDNPKPTVKGSWNSHLDCGVLFESFLWARFHDRAKTYADWVWYSSKIGELRVCSLTRPCLTGNVGCRWEDVVVFAQPRLPRRASHRHQGDPERVQGAGRLGQCSRVPNTNDAWKENWFISHY